MIKRWFMRQVLSKCDLTIFVEVMIKKKWIFKNFPCDKVHEVVLYSNEWNDLLKLYD